MIRRAGWRPAAAAVLGVGVLLLVAGLGVAGGTDTAGTATVGHGLDGTLTWVMLTPEPGLDDGDMENFGVLAAPLGLLASGLLARRR